jgi:hypothetical protein
LQREALGAIKTTHKQIWPANISGRGNRKEADEAEIGCNEMDTCYAGKLAGELFFFYARVVA